MHNVYKYQESRNFILNVLYSDGQYLLKVLNVNFVYVYIYTMITSKEVVLSVLFICFFVTEH